MSSAPLPWIKMHTSLPTHRKSVELGMLLGDKRAWTYQAALLLWAGAHAQDGRIRGERAEQLAEYAAGWEGGKGELVQALLTVGFLERELGDDGYQSALVIHGWDEEQGAHVAKVLKDRTKTPTTPSKPPDASPPNPRAGSPGVEGERELELEKEETTLSGKPDPVVVLDESEPAIDPDPPPFPPEPAAAALVFEYWREWSGHVRAKFDGKRKRAVKARLRDGYSAEELCRAVDGCLLTPHNCGENERGERYDDLELICRDAAHVDRFIRNATDPPKAKASGKSPVVLTEEANAKLSHVGVVSW